MANTTTLSPEKLIDYPIMDGVKVLQVRDDVLYDCLMPTDRIDIEGIPTDRVKLGDLREEIKIFKSENGGTGLKKAIDLGYVAGRPKAQPTDGYHRTTIMVENQEPTILSTVELMTLERFIDERIKNASMHDNIRHARTAQWMGEAWSLMPMSERITVVQAATLTMNVQNGLGSGKQLKLSKHEVDECMGWIEAKAQIWRMSISTMVNILRDAANLAPDIAAGIRLDPASAHEGQLTIKPAAAKSIGREIDVSKPEHQRLAAETCVTYGLNAQQLKTLSAEISRLTIEEARRLVANRDWVAVKARGKVEKASSFSFKSTDLLNVSANAHTALRPLVTIATETTAEIMEMDQRNFPPETIARILRDFKNARAQIDDAITIIEASGNHQTTEKVDPTKVDKNPTPRRGAQTRKSLDTFLSKLGQSLDDGRFPPITSDTEAEAVEQMLGDPEITNDVEPSILAALKKHLAGRG